MIDNILGNKTNIRILRLLNKFPNRYFTIKEIQENTGLGFGNIFYSIKILEYHDIIIPENGKIRAFKVNKDNLFNGFLDKFFFIENRAFQNIDLDILKILSEIEQEIIKNLNNVNNIILFGSIARGAYRKDSDIDIAIIKTEKNSDDKLKLTQIFRKYDRDIQPHIFTEEEFKKSTEPLIKNIKKEGISLTKILEHNQSRLEDF